MFRNAIAPVIGSTLLLAFAAAAQDVYQWKDAQGITHYSEAPPATGKYEQRAGNREATPAANAAAPATAANAPTAAAKPPASDVQCATTRQNLALLESKASVQQDVDGDGKPDKNLDDRDRANQLELARAQLKAQNCGG